MMVRVSVSRNVSYCAPNRLRLAVSLLSDAARLVVAVVKRPSRVG